MGNSVSDEKRKKQKQVMLSPDIIGYLDEKAPNFARGGRGGFSAALEECVRIVMRHEEELGKEQ